MIIARIRLPITSPGNWFPSGVCYGSLWAIADTSVVRFDTATNTVAAVIQLTGAKSANAPIQGFFSAIWVACAAGKVWVPNLAGLYSIDAQTNVATRLPIAIHPNSQLGDPGITASNGSVYIRTSDTTVTQVDAATGKPSRTFPATGGGGE